MWGKTQPALNSRLTPLYVVTGFKGVKIKTIIPHTVGTHFFTFHIVLLAILSFIKRFPVVFCKIKFILLEPSDPSDWRLCSWFCSMERLGVFLILPGWDSNPLEGNLPASSLPVPFYRQVCMERGTVRVKCLAQEHSTMSCWLQWQGLEPRPLHPEMSTITMGPLHLPRVIFCGLP